MRLHETSEDFMGLQNMLETSKDFMRLYETSKDFMRLYETSKDFMISWDFMSEVTLFPPRVDLCST
jgi:hypothetical protein